MTIDIIVPTYNRASLLPRLLSSIHAATRPSELSVRVIVVDNNSTDDTSALVAAARKVWVDPLEYSFERVQSRAAALNNGLGKITADLVGFVDDDEEIDRHWFEVVDREFRDPSVGFISGPYLPRWGAPPPQWLPKGHRGVVGWADGGDRTVEFGRQFPGVMLGGNAVIRTELGKSVGWYNATLGRVGDKPGTGCEDVELFNRLMAAGARGLYVPDLIIYHYIPPARLTKQFHRRWCFNRSVAQATADAQRPQPVHHVLGVPRYMIGSALRSVPVMAKALCGGTWSTSEVFDRELAIWELAGYARGLLRRRERRRLQS